METFRYGSFETNSSSEHTMTYCSDPRTADELPELAENGNLEIEIKHFWHCGGEGCETSDLRDIIEYLYMLAANAGTVDIYPGTPEESFAAYEDQIRSLYEFFGKEPPKHVTAYFLDVNDQRHEYRNNGSLYEFPVFVNGLKENEGYEIFMDGHDYFESPEDFHKEFYPNHKGALDKGVWAKHCIGIACGLSWCPYTHSANYFYDCYDENDDNRTAWDLLTTKSTLEFIHT